MRRKQEATPSQLGREGRCVTLPPASGAQPLAVPSTHSEETQMTRIKSVVVVYALLILLGSSLVLAQQPPQQPMTFFVTSAGSGDGAKLGGLAGAAQIRQAPAQASGAGSHTWHAYLSTQASGGQPAVNARDRIGAGPWYNAKGARIAKD